MERILLVDDELLVRHFVKFVLVRDGFEVVEADDGLKALSALRKLKGELSLIVSDVVMPRLDGISFCLEVKKEFPNIPVLLISGNEPQAHRIGDRYLQKPLRPETLIRTVRDLVTARCNSKAPIASDL